MSTVGSKQSFLTEAFGRGTDMKAEQRASPQRGHTFSRVCTAACIAQFPSVACLTQGYWWIRSQVCPKTFWGFRRRARSTFESLQRTPPLWQLHQSSMKSTCLLCSLQRMHDGWSKLLILNFKPPIKAAPQQCPQKAHFKFSRVCTAACGDFLRRNAWRKLSRLSPSSLTYVWVAAKNDSWRSATIEPVCLRSVLQLATCCMILHDGWSKLNLNFTRSHESFATVRSPKIDSEEKSFHLEVANQLASYF